MAAGNDLAAEVTRLRERQDLLIASMDRLAGALENVRDQQREMLAWMQQPPSNALPDALRTLAAVVTEMHGALVTLGRDLPSMVADEVLLKCRS